MNGSEPQTVDFYVAPKSGGSGVPYWFVYRRSPTACVDAASDARGALVKAVRMAQFCRLGGQSSQVHLREHDKADWHTVWCPPLEAKRFP